ncbi:larval cuticle protein 65Ag1-like [Diachasma alloeum]|uniref:larval cuticle protein 65Ag1-like n=1 Tax=Diachasma alloeum TaxID=454923 RepID=UPI00073838A4|nr:larval cuticle protein 65Ag1-like [Diachasma alloeum]
MKMIIVLAALVAIASAAPQRQQQEVVVVKQIEHNNIGLPEGYGYEYELSDGSSRQEQAQFESATDEEGKPVQAIVVRGQYSFVGEDGVTYTVNYTADKDGFHPEGAHLPVGPVA